MPTKIPPPPLTLLHSRAGSFAIGIDVGGTKIAAGLVEMGAGAVTAKRIAPTSPSRDGGAVLADVLLLAHALVDQARRQRREVSAIGLGVCELVNLRGEVTSDYTIAWKGVPVQTALNEIAPATVESDVRAHALAEARFGAGQRYDPFVFVSVGTGISACLVAHGQPYAGARGNALVLGTGPISVPIVDGQDDAEHTTWARHVMEEYASGSGLVTRYGGVTRAEEIFAAAERGDGRAIHVLTSAGRSLGSSLGWLASVLDPQAIVVGGGLGTAHGLYWDSLVRSTREHIWAEDTRALPIVHASLGADAGVIGAAMAAWAAVALRS